MRGHVEPYRRRDQDGAWRPVRGKWRCVIELGVHQGKRSRETFTVVGGKKEAEAELAERLGRLRKSAKVAPVTGTLGEWLDEWLRLYVEPKARSGELSLSTLAGYEGAVRRYLKPELADVPLKKLRPEQVTALYAKMALAKSQGGYGVKARSREQVHMVLRAALAKAVELNRVRFNIMERGHGVDRPRVPHREVTALEQDAAIELLSRLSSAQGDSRRLFLPAYLALATGMRRGELFALRWNEVSLPAASESGELGVITVSRAWDRGSADSYNPLERYRLKGPKNGRVRYVDIGPEIVGMLRKVKAEQAAQRLAAGSAWCTSARRSDGSVLDWGDLVITADNGLPWWPDSFSSRWRAWCIAEGIQCRFHDLRATSLSIALSNGADPEVVRQRAGHHSAAFFLERYAKAMRHARERDAGIMNGLLTRVSG